MMTTAEITMRKALFALLPALACLSGCGDIAPRQGQNIRRPTPAEISTLQANLSYFRDPKSGLCFGTITQKTGEIYVGASITCVPCEKVEKLLIDPNPTPSK